MPKHQKYAPKHRQQAEPKASSKALRNSLLLSSIAVAATGVSVGGGVAGAPTSASDVMNAATDLGSSAPVSAAQLERRQEQVSRSDRRSSTDPAKAAALSTQGAGKAFTRTEDASEADPRTIARTLLPAYGFSADQFGCLDSLYESESGWRIDADNPTSSAYGIPQALTQMHDLPADYRTSAEAQIRWGLDYIRDSYGTPCSAWSFKQGHNWY